MSTRPVRGLATRLPRSHSELSRKVRGEGMGIGATAIASLSLAPAIAAGRDPRPPASAEGQGLVVADRFPGQP
jgi:hypothetical protein